MARLQLHEKSVQGLASVRRREAGASMFCSSPPQTCLGTAPTPPSRLRVLPSPGCPCAWAWGNIHISGLGTGGFVSIFNWMSSILRLERWDSRVAGNVGEAWLQIPILPLTVSWTKSHNLSSLSLLICKMGIMIVSILSGTWLIIIYGSDYNGHYGLSLCCAKEDDREVDGLS